MEIWVLEYYSLTSEGIYFLESSSMYFSVSSREI